MLIRWQILSYVLHRYVLHNPTSPFTKYHLNWHHSLSIPYSMVANYDHPIAYIIRVFLPAYIPALLCRFHLLTYQLYLAIVSLEETFAYSGYNVLPSGLILGGIARRQERHLISEGGGNFGCFGVMDFVLGTSLGQDVVEDVTEEVEEKMQNKRGKKTDKAPRKKVSRGRKPKEPRGANGNEHEDEEAEPQSEETESPKRRTRGGRRAKS